MYQLPSGVVVFSGNRMTIDTSAAMVSLQEVLAGHASGKPSYLDFWATWCFPCLGEFQHSPRTKQLGIVNHMLFLYLCV